MAERGKGPFSTVDACIEVKGGLVLIRRKFEPIGWALPGGFVDPGEDLATACKREAKEETGLDVTLVTQLFTYSDPSRDPRKHTISTVFAATADGEPEGGDDAGEAKIFPLDRIPFAELAFDHASIVKDWLAWRTSGKRRAL